MTSESIPLGATYSYSYDAMSNLSGFTGTDGFSASATYNFAGQRTSLSYTDTSHWQNYFVGETRTYNNLLQLVRLQGLGVDDEYIYQTGQNNGRIVQLIDHALGETVNYTYDSLNRLASAEEATGKWGNAFSYDGWGSMNGQSWTPGQPATPIGTNYLDGKSGKRRKGTQKGTRKRGQLGLHPPAETQGQKGTDASVCQPLALAQIFHSFLTPFALWMHRFPH